MGEMNTFQLPGVACACGSAELVSVKTGVDPQRSGMPLIDLLLDRGAPDVAWCRTCWLRAFPALNQTKVASHV